MIGYAPFLGQVNLAPPVLGQFPPYEPTEESRSQKAVRLNKSLDDTLSLYSGYRFDQATIDRLNAKVENCRTLIGRIFTDPDVAASESSAKACLQDLRYAFQAAQFAYEESARSAASGALTTSAVIIGIIGAASIGVSAYHGYKRNNSTGWAVWWGFMGALFPVLTPAIAIAQGYGKREKK